MISQEYLKSILHYNLETGIFTWITKRKRIKIDTRCDVPHHKGYRQISIDGVSCMAHRLAWIYVTGNQPKQLIDHVNGIKDDNRWINLREATPSENLRNQSGRNILKTKGVYKTKQGKYRVLMTIGTYDNLEKAKLVFDTIAKMLHGEFFKS